MNAIEKSKRQDLLVPPHGWKRAVAEVMKVHVNTITNNLKKGEGEVYNRIIHTAKQIYNHETNQKRND